MGRKRIFLGMSGGWFEQRAFRRLEIRGPEGARSVIEDAGYLERLVARIEAIDADGPLRKKIGPNPRVIELIFEPAPQGKPEVHEIINGMLKTPSTGFHRGRYPAVEEIVSEIESLLAPALGKTLPLVVGTPLKLDGFEITYRGRTHEDHAPATLQTNTAEFDVASARGIETLRVVSGQLPPRPLHFAVAGTEYVLFTYESPAGRRLYPRAFVVDRA